MEPIYGYTKTAADLVVLHANKRSQKEGYVDLTPEEVYVVFFTYTLGNWKAMVSTSRSDGLYYEVTHNVTKGETYVDSYKKWENTVYPNKPLEPETPSESFTDRIQEYI